MSAPNQQSRHTKRRIHHFPMLKQCDQKITMVTAYDYPTGLAADEAGVDAVLVGDSLGMVALGYESTIPVTMDVMVHHTAAVSRGVKRAFVIADMPFLAASAGVDTAVLNAGRLVQEGGAEGVKIEGGLARAGVIRAIVEAGIPVIGHIGLIPQSVHALGGYKVQGRDDESVERLVDDALAVERAGAFAIVLEAMLPETAAAITEKLTVPTIGIGAGKKCGGQVLVITDLLGSLPGEQPRFSKQFINLSQLMVQGISEFCRDVRDGSFPQAEHEY